MNETATDNKKTPLLDVSNLSIEFQTEDSVVRPVEEISFVINAGETVGLVGESGCGKSITSLSLLGLIPSPPGRITMESSIKYNGKQLVGLNESDLRKIRGKKISMIFQEPMTALNPVLTVGEQMTDVLVRHKNISRKTAYEESITLLEQVGIPSPAERIKNYPHQLSGGMRQRVMIAMALSCNPGLLLADEPTTALDVTVQAQVLELIKSVQKKWNTAIIFITHDLAVVAEFCERVIVMYCGKIIESAPVNELFSQPRHPYTVGLLESIPRISETKMHRLPTIEGVVPDPHHFPRGCRFADRCNRVKNDCREKQPPLVEIENGCSVACYYPYA